MLQNIGGVSAVLALIMFMAALSSILLARVLPKSGFGQFTLMRTLILFIPPLAIWGQDLSTARFFSRNSPMEYDWHRAFFKVWTGSVLLSLLAVTAAVYFYQLSAQQLFILAAACLLYSSILFVSNLVRSQRRYNQAILILNGFRGLYLLLLILLSAFALLNTFSAVVGYVAIIGIVAVFGIIYVVHSIPAGEKTVPKEYYHSGLILMGSQVAVTVMNSMDSLLIPYLIDYQALALYAACLIPIRVYGILGRAGKYVWVPEFGRSATIRIKRITIAVTALALLLLVMFILFAKPVLHLLYSGKYDNGFGVLRILAAAGALKLIYTLSSSLIVGKLNNYALRWYTRINIVTTLVYIILLYVLIKLYGVTGAAAALLAISLFRLLASYGLLYKFRTQLNNGAPV